MELPQIPTIALTEILPMKVCDKDIGIEGTLIRIARLDADKYKFLDDEEAVLSGLRNCGSRVDLLTFLHRLAETSPNSPDPRQWDNLAVLPVSTFEQRRN